MLSYRIEEWLKLDAEHILEPFSHGSESIDVALDLLYENSRYVRVTVNDTECVFANEWNIDSANKKMLKRFAVLCLYKTCVKHFGFGLPWGSLTGVRPTKLAYEFLNGGGKEDDIADYLVDVYDVSRDKAEACEKTIVVQRKCLANVGRGVNLYIHIPFCNTRCNYCSFPSVICNDNALLDNYFQYLLRDIELTKELIAENGNGILSVYIGGGTPSVLSSHQIEKLLKTVNFSGEITFEAGREDSLNEDKFKAMKDGGVTRVCINPQTFNETTLRLIGRRQSTDGFFNAFFLAKKHGFIINTDLIAGFENETITDFEKSVKVITDIKPENVTVHSLCRKRGSANAECSIFNPDIKNMMNYAWGVFSDEYNPYYIYRQKYGLGGYENVGFAVPGTECINNITVMEEFVSVYACGAGGISKRINNGSIDRLANVKDILLYINDFDVRFDEKKKLFGD